MTQEIKEKKIDTERSQSKNSDCCMPEEHSLLSIGYNKQELDHIRESSIVGMGCEAPINYADIEVLSEQVYLNEDKTDGRIITSLVIGAITGK